MSGMSEETRRADAPGPAPGAGQPVGDFPLPKPALLAEAIADSVAEAIATGHLAPGERIVETALAEKYGVSRVPVREALKVLATQGILVGGGHRGCRVASFAPEKIEQVFEVRLELETILLRDAVANWRRSGEGLGALDSVIGTMRQAARAGDLRGMLRADLEFHRTICRASQKRDRRRPVERDRTSRAHHLQSRPLPGRGPREGARPALEAPGLDPGAGRGGDRGPGDRRFPVNPGAALPVAPPGSQPGRGGSRR